MPETKFTPGPWLVQREQSGEIAIWTRQPLVGTVAFVLPTDINGEWPAEANAALIKAAPRLYAALEELARHADDMEAQHSDYHTDEGPLRSQPLNDALAALAEARGES